MSEVKQSETIQVSKLISLSVTQTRWQDVFSNAAAAAADLFLMAAICISMTAAI